MVTRAQLVGAAQREAQRKAAELEAKRAAAEREAAKERAAAEREAAKDRAADARAQLVKVAKSLDKKVLDWGLLNPTSLLIWVEHDSHLSAILRPFGLLKKTKLLEILKVIGGIRDMGDPNKRSDGAAGNRHNNPILLPKGIDCNTLREIVSVTNKCCQEQSDLVATYRRGQKPE